eukprot:g49629.t1
MLCFVRCVSASRLWCAPHAMWLLERMHSNTERLLFAGELKVGRGGDCDIRIEKDLKISRCHCKIAVTAISNVSNLDDRGSVTLEDCGSKFGTVVSWNGEEQVLQKSRKKTLGDGAMFTLGSSAKGKFRLKWRHLACCFSRLDKEQQTKLKAVAVKLGAHLSSKWDDRCTHILMSSLIVTEKVLLGLIKGLPIVTPQWLHETLKVLQSDPFKPQPDVKSFLPKPEAPGIVEKLGIDSAKRSTVFKGIDFFVFQPKQQARIQNVVHAAGGQVSLVQQEKDHAFWEERPKFVLVSPFTADGLPIDRYERKGPLIAAAEANIAVLHSIYDQVELLEEAKIFQATLDVTVEDLDAFLNQPSGRSKVHVRDPSPSGSPKDVEEKSQVSQPASDYKQAGPEVGQRSEKKASRPKKRRRTAWKESEEQFQSQLKPAEEKLLGRPEPQTAEPAPSVEPPARRGRGAWKEQEDMHVNGAPVSGEDEKRQKRSRKAGREEEDSAPDAKQSRGPRAPAVQTTSSAVQTSSLNHQSEDHWTRRKFVEQVPEEEERPFDDSKILHSRGDLASRGLVAAKAPVLSQDVPFRSAKLSKCSESGLVCQDELDAGAFCHEEEAKSSSDDLSSLNFKRFKRNQDTVSARRQRLKNYVPFDHATATESRVINRGWDEEFRSETRRKRIEDDLFDSKQRSNNAKKR